MRLFQVPIAHRGLHDQESPENSLSAFQKAVNKGYNIETDVHLLKDGKLVCFHDFTLSRMLNGRPGYIEDLRYEDIAGENFLLSNGEHIPLFDDLINLVDGRVEILCELKSTSFRKFRLEKAVYEAIKDKPWIKIQAFNPFTVLWFARHAPEICRGQLATRPPNRLLKPLFPYRFLRRSHPDFFAYDVRFLPCDAVTKACKDYNMKLLAWTVDSDEKVETAKKSNANNIIFEHIRPEKYPV
jgi:glycerophosphoryl diester phosphodiesterase